MEQIGKQVKLPLSRALQIAVQGIRIRFGRSLVTVSGVVLGVAFFMSNVTAQLVKKAIADERAQRQTLNLMQTLVKGEIGDYAGKTIAIAVFGKTTASERDLLALLRNTPGLTVRDSAAGAHLLLILGDGPASAAPETLAAGMVQPVLLDSLSDRSYPSQGAYSEETPAPRRELFFGRESEEQAVRFREQAEQAAFRTLWIGLISVLVTVIGIANALLMSVTERFREIGTMKCLGALSAFIRKLFLIESALIGFAGSAVGTLLGAVLSLAGYGLTFGFGPIGAALHLGWFLAAAGACVAGGTILAMIAAIYPANFAARMVPASALRSTV